MKTKLSVLLASLMLLAGPLAFAHDHGYPGHHHCNGDASVVDTTLWVITSTTLPPLTTTTLVVCAITDDAEVNRIMIEREATMVKEENKIFVPSFLGAYADRQNLEIRAAADDVLVNGVR